MEVSLGKSSRKLNTFGSIVCIPLFIVFMMIVGTIYAITFIFGSKK